MFERSSASISSTRRGAGLGLDVNGQKALEAINPGAVPHSMWQQQESANITMDICQHIM